MSSCWYSNADYTSLVCSHLHMILHSRCLIIPKASKRHEFIRFSKKIHWMHNFLAANAATVLIHSPSHLFTILLFSGYSVYNSLNISHWHLSCQADSAIALYIKLIFYEFLSVSVFRIFSSNVISHWITSI